jgi:hypothetical protein
LLQGSSGPPINRGGKYPHHNFDYQIKYRIDDGLRLALASIWFAEKANLGQEGDAIYILDLSLTASTIVLVSSH